MRWLSTRSLRFSWFLAFISPPKRNCLTISVDETSSPLKIRKRYRQLQALLPLLQDPKNRRMAIQLHAQLLILRHECSDEPTLTLWNALLRHYSFGPDHPEESINLYRQMQSTLHAARDTFTFVFVFKACTNSLQPRTGNQFYTLAIKDGFEHHVHVRTSLLGMYLICGVLVSAVKLFNEMPDRNVVTSNAMITGLARWGEVGIARSVFDGMKERNVITWTGIIDAYTREQRCVEALKLFRRMIREGFRPNEVTFLAVVPAVSSSGTLEVCESIHGYCEKKGLVELDVRVENSLIDMYAKCGSIDKSLKIFNLMSSSRRNSVSWTTIISGYAMHGMANKAMELFEKMSHQENAIRLFPNRVTFLSVLNACSHGGLVEEGMLFFKRMVYDHGIVPESKHYGCLIDMLGRAGRLGDAEKIIVGMPFEVGPVVWRSLLGCCGKHGEAEVGKRAMKRITEKEKSYGGDYVVMSNILCGSGRFGDAEETRRLLDSRSAVKMPGFSSIGVNVS